MPRTALFVDLENDNPAHQEVAICTSEVEFNNRDNKVLRSRRFRGVVNRRYIYLTVTSKTVLPFVILDEQLPIVVLPIEFHSDEPEILSREQLITYGHRTTADWFERIDRELGENHIRRRINVRGKLTQQRYGRKPFLIHCGAGGTHPCGAIQVLDPSSDIRFIADQTTYVLETDNEDEAFFIIGMLNSQPLEDMICSFQSAGLFGRRHIHKLALAAIPPFENGNPAHQLVVNKSRDASAAALRSANPGMRDLSRALTSRRTELRRAIARELGELDGAVRRALDQ